MEDTDNTRNGVFITLTPVEINIMKDKIKRFGKLADYIQDDYKELYNATYDITKKTAYDIYNDLLDHANYFCKLASDLVNSPDIEKECNKLRNDEKRFKECYDEFHFVQNYININKFTIDIIKSRSMNDTLFDLFALFISEFRDIISFFNTYTFRNLLF